MKSFLLAAADGLLLVLLCALLVAGGVAIAWSAQAGGLLAPP